MAKVFFDEQEKVTAGLRVCRGESLAEVASDYGCHPDTVKGCIAAALQSLPGYSSTQHIVELRKPGVGAVKAARVIYRQLSE